MERLKKELGQRARVVRIDVRSEAGRRARRALGIEVVPALVVLDAGGKERWRQTRGLPDRRRVLAEVSACQPDNKT